MSFRLVIGVDPGLSGGIGVLADGEFEAAFDMPVMAKPNGKNKIDAANFAGLIREACARHPCASVTVVLENVQPMPSKQGERSMGATSAFSFGRSVGAIEGVIAALRLPLVEVAPVRWKTALGLRGADKDATRTQMIQRFPAAAERLARKKDIGRADAIGLALWKHRDDGLFDGEPVAATRLPEAAIA